MQINIVTIIPFPVESVFAAMRDHMPELVEFMPNIGSIEVAERREENGEVFLINRWNAADTEVPAVARPFIDPSDVYWFDHAHWLGDGRTCNWRLEMGFMADRVRCSGRTEYVALNAEQTEMRIEGELELDLSGLVPRLLRGRVTAGVEKFVGKLVEPNFEKTSDALIRYLETESNA